MNVFFPGLRAENYAVSVGADVSEKQAALEARVRELSCLLVAVLHVCCIYHT